MKYLIFFYIVLFFSHTFANDERPGRFFEDQPDINDDYQMGGVMINLI